MNEFLLKNKKTVVIGVLLLLGLLLVFVGTPSKKEEKKESGLTFDEEEYEKKLESRLTELLEAVNGVGDVRVMITLEGSATYTYATDVSQDSGSTGSLKRESTVVLSLDGNSKKDPVVSGYVLPRVKGAAVVCTKPLTPTLQAKVIGVVSSALGVSSSKIFVTN